MFINCTLLEEIHGLNLSGLDYTSNYKGQVEASGMIASNCPALKIVTLTTGTDVKVVDNSNNPYFGVNFVNCPNIEVNYLNRIIDALYNYSRDNQARFLNIGSTNISKLSSEKIRSAVSKNWTLL